MKQFQFEHVPPWRTEIRRRIIGAVDKKPRKNLGPSVTCLLLGRAFQAECLLRSK